MRGSPDFRRRLGRWLARLHWLTVEGLEHVPASGRTVVAFNHCGVRGGLLFESLIQRDVVFLASARFLRFALVRPLAEKLCAIFVSPADMTQMRLFREAGDAIDGGSLLGVMVPGRQMTATQGTPKRGAVYLAWRLKANLLPVEVRLRGLRVRVRVSAALPPPRSVSARDLDARFAEVCAAIRVSHPALNDRLGVAP